MKPLQEIPVKLSLIHQRTPFVLAVEIKVLQVSSYNPYTGDVLLTEIDFGGRNYQTNIYFMPLIESPRPGDRFVCIVEGNTALPIGTVYDKYSKKEFKLDFIPYDARAIIINRLNYLFMALGFFEVKSGALQLTMNEETETISMHSINYEFYAGKNRVKIDGKNGEIEIENSKDNDPVVKESVKIRDSEINIKTQGTEGYSEVSVSRDGQVKISALSSGGKLDAEYNAQDGKVEIVLNGLLSLNMDKTGIKLENKTGGLSAIELLPGGIVKISGTAGVVVEAPAVTLPPVVAVGGAPAGGVLLPTATKFDFNSFIIWLRLLNTWLSTHIHPIPDGSTLPPATPPPPPPR